MTTSLQELIDDSIFISTEHQARLAELSQGVEWDVDFSVPSFTLQSDPPVVLTPHLLGTDSADRGSWVWAWQELGHFPAEVVAAAVQTRESAARAELTELTTDELPSQDGLARQLTLATKALTGIWTHYPARVGKNVTAWLLLTGSELDLEPVTTDTMMRVIAEALQTGTATDHNRALDSYAKLRGIHIEWDTDAMCVLTTRDGAQRFWLENRQITGVEPAESTVSDDELSRLEQEARTRREALAADRADARLMTEDTLSEDPLPAELSPEDLNAPVPTNSPEVNEDLPYDQEPRRDVAPGEVTTTTVPPLTEQVDEATGENVSAEESPAEDPGVDVPEETTTHEPAADELTTADLGDRTDEQPTKQPPAPDEEHVEEAPQPKKKGFFNRFFGL